MTQPQPGCIILRQAALSRFSKCGQNQEIGSLASVSTGKVVEHGKGKKVIVFKYKPKKNIRKKNGHRQPYTKVEITAIA